MVEHCPKCHAERIADACPRCGLVFARFDEHSIATNIPEELEELWQRIERDWQDRSLHAIFLERSLAQGRGDFAVSRYRQRGDDPLAEENTRRIVDRMQQILLRSASPRPRRTLRRLLGVLILALLLFGLALLSGLCTEGFGL